MAPFVLERSGRACGWCGFVLVRGMILGWALGWWEERCGCVMRTWAKVWCGVWPCVGGGMGCPWRFLVRVAGL